VGLDASTGERLQHDRSASQLEQSLLGRGGISRHRVGNPRASDRNRG
jgi:hypothetical protein